MPKNTPSKDTIAMRTAGGPHFDNNFQTHMMLGNNVDGNGAHSGLHSLNTALAQYPNLAEVARVATDSRNNNIYCADIRLKGGKTPKRSSFFPATMNFAAIQTAVTNAWLDYKIYSPESEIYRQLRDKYGLSWVGLASIGGRKFWIGCTRSGSAQNPIETAFPAVDHKFF